MLVIVPREKVERRFEYREVVYDDEHWELLKEKRAKALEVVKALRKFNLSPLVHGSIARGDVSKSSDVDVVIPYVVPSYVVELALENAGLAPVKRIIVQATPSHTPKAYLVLDELEERVVSFPLAKLLKREYEFYLFGGALDYDGLCSDKRVPGVDKRLVLIEPTPRGHRESPVIGREAEVAKILGVSIDVVEERVRVLTRRDAIGRAGVFVSYTLAPEETFEEALHKLARSNPHVRRVLIERGAL